MEKNHLAKVTAAYPPAPRPGGPRTRRGHLREHRADGLGHIQPPGQRERRQQRVAHPAPQPGHEDLPVPARLPDITPVPRPEHQRPGTRRAVPSEGTPDHGRTPRTHRPQAGTAIRWPRATPPRIPSRGRRNTGVPDPEDVPPAVATTGTTSTCCPGPTARCVRRRAAREAPFRNKRRSTNVGDAEVDA